MTEMPAHAKIESSRISAKFPEPPMITDEELMLYADGALPPERRAAIRAALATDPSLMERLESFLFTRGPFARAYDEVLDAPVPDRLYAPFRGAAEHAAPPAPRRLLGFLYGAKPKPRAASSRVALLMAAAACLLVVGAGLGRFAFPQTQRYDFVVAEDHSMVRAQAVQRALESSPSNELVIVSELISVRPISTLPSPRGTWCRELELLYREGPRGLLLACRDADGAWHIPKSDPTNKTYDVALGQSPEAAMLESVKGLLGRPVTPAREKRLREGQWQEKP